MTIRLGVDIGGTFTDLWDFDEQTQALHTLKVRSRPEAPGQKILDGIEPLERTASNHWKAVMARFSP